MREGVNAGVEGREVVIWRDPDVPALPKFAGYKVGWMNLIRCGRLVWVLNT